jgi:plasmid stability protein
VTQLTLRGIPDALNRAIRERAQREKKSINRTVTDILAEALGVEAGSAKKRDLSDLAGSWSEAEVREFEAALAPFEQIDESEWT